MAACAVLIMSGGILGAGTVGTIGNTISPGLFAPNDPRVILTAAALLAAGALWALTRQVMRARQRNDRNN